ncbi:MAG: hypothetical protein CMJ58_10110 [Planctomycetaceae bacterium]|nr:hypothetical protein [Planctomycetaceae bacterium]
MTPPTEAPHSDDPFDWICRSPLGLPPSDQWRFGTLAAMLSAEQPEDDERPVLLGADHTGPLDITLADVRRAAQRADAWRAEQGLQAGDSVLLVRLPHSSEAPLAVAAVALMSLGLRVVLPMSFDAATLPEMAAATNCRAVLRCTAEIARSDDEAVGQADTLFRAVAEQVNASAFSLDEQLNWHVAPAEKDAAPPPLPGAEGEAPADRELLVLSTSGSTGRPKLVRYTEAALLSVAEAWRAAGLMDEQLTGGRSICPALSHSMGFRNVLHAVWNRQPTLLAQPEWLEEAPKKFVKLLQRCRPQHITCGPALLRDLSLLARTIQRVKDGLSSLECVVSSGAADPAAASVLPEGVRVANAFGMTEVQQALNTLLGSETAPRGALGRPLPGVAVAVQFDEPQQRQGRLFVSSPGKARGYVGESDFGEWFETGDVVRVEGDDLVWVGRTGEDFLNTGQGVKVSLAELREAYPQLQAAAEAVLFVSPPSCSGIGAVAYVGEHDPADAARQQALREAAEADHQRLADNGRDFALEYAAVSAIACVAGSPPRRGPGKIDRQRAIQDATDLLDALADPATNNPQIVAVPRFGSDRPDWRRYASDIS